MVPVATKPHTQISLSAVTLRFPLFSDTAPLESYNFIVMV